MKPLDRLREQYRLYKNANSERLKKLYYSSYANMRLFCLDCELLTFNEIELMEFEVDESLSV